MANQNTTCIAVVDIKRVVGDEVPVHVGTLAEKLKLPPGVYGNIEHDHHNQDRRISEVYQYVLNNYDHDTVWGKLARAFREMRLYQAATRLQLMQNQYPWQNPQQFESYVPNAINGLGHADTEVVPPRRRPPPAPPVALPEVTRPDAIPQQTQAQTQQSKGQAIICCLFLWALIGLYAVIYYKSMYWILGRCTGSCVLVGCMYWFGLLKVQSVVTTLNTLRQLAQLF